MNIMIWDIEWYYAEDKTNLINVDAMKISSYHKQRGDNVYLVKSKYDIKREWDMMYICKEYEDSPTPPLSLTLGNSKIIKIGSGWKRSDSLNKVVAACRPDYLLYPNMQKSDNTALERSEYWRFLDDEGNLLPLIQDASRNEKKNFIIVADKGLWDRDEKIILKVLRKIQDLGKYVSFLEPISIEKLLSNKTLTQQFLELKFKQNNNIRWTELKLDNADKFIYFYQEFKREHKNIVFQPLEINPESITVEKMLEYTNIIARCFLCGLPITIKCNKNKKYPQIVKILSDYTNGGKNLSWLEYITYRYHKNIKDNSSAIKLWLSPSRWDSNFRELLSLTYGDLSFLCIRPNKTLLSAKDIPTNVFKKTFKYGI